jgi:hypothetical protein
LVKVHILSSLGKLNTNFISSHPVSSEEMKDVFTSLQFQIRQLFFHLENTRSSLRQWELQNTPSSKGEEIQEPGLDMSILQEADSFDKRSSVISPNGSISVRGLHGTQGPDLIHLNSSANTGIHEQDNSVKAESFKAAATVFESPVLGDLLGFDQEELESKKSNEPQPQVEEDQDLLEFDQEALPEDSNMGPQQPKESRDLSKFMFLFQDRPHVSTQKFWKKS